VTGVGALVAGGLAGIGLAVATGGDARAAIGGAAGSAIWAGARLLAMRVAIGDGRDQRSAVTNAWARGLLPYLGAMSTGLRIVAFAGSAYMTHAALAPTLETRSNVRRAIMWAFGGQALVIGGAWAFQAVWHLL